MSGTFFKARIQCGRNKAPVVVSTGEHGAVVEIEHTLTSRPTAVDDNP